MELINSSAVFYPRGNLPARIVNHVNYTIDFQKLSVPFTGRSTTKLGQNVLNYLNLVKDIPKTYSNNEM